MRILIGVNVLDSVKSYAYANHCEFWYKLGKQFPDIQFYFMPPERMSIDNMRNTAAKVAMELECDYLMFIDDDMLLDMNTMKSLLDADKDIVMAHTFIRGYPFKPMCFQRTDDGTDSQNWIIENHTDESLEAQKDENGLVPCVAVGFAVVLIKTRLLYQLPAPYFLTSPGQTEDVYFCIRCQRELENVTIAVDMKVPTGHILSPEIVHAKTVAALREYHKPEAKEDAPRDRGEDYLKKCLPELITT